MGVSLNDVSLQRCNSFRHLFRQEKTRLTKLVTPPPTPPRDHLEAPLRGRGEGAEHNRYNPSYAIALGRGLG